MFNRSNNTDVATYYKNNFVQMPDPLNHCGKEVFIHKSVQKEFAKYTRQASKDFNLLYFYKQIASLSNVGFFNSWVSTKTALSRRLNIEGGYVLYALWDGKVYVEHIQMDSQYVYKKGKANIPAGAYRIKKLDDSNTPWSPGQDRNSAEEVGIVNTKHMAINGHCEDIMDAANYMPAFIEYGYGTGSLTNTYTLFFNPSQGFVGGDWKALRDSTGIAGTQASKKLAEVLIETSKKNQEVNLTVHENGHALLKESLRIVNSSNVKLNQFTVFYANPTQNLNLVDGLRKKSEMQLAKKAPLVNSTSASQYLLSGNAVSQPLVAMRADSSNAFAISYDTIAAGLGLYGLKSIGAGFIGAAGWGLAIAPYLAGQNRSLNKEVIEKPSQALQSGLKKLVWDPVHKMMVKA